MIRNAEYDDLPQIKSLALSAWLNAYRGIMTEDEIRAENEKFYTAEFHSILLGRCATGNHIFNLKIVDGTVVGLMDFDFDETQCWLMRFYLSPSLIGRGFGSELLNYSETQLTGLGKTHYHLMVHEDNLLGRRYYDRKGFVREPRKDSPEDGEVCYRKALLKST